MSEAVADAVSNAVEVRSQRVIGRPFEPGQIANPAGRPPGSRNKLGEHFLRAMADDFEAHGPEAIEVVRKTRPQDYLKVIASILPKIIAIKADELEAHTEDELRQAYARELRKFIAFGVAVGIEINKETDAEARTIEAAAIPALPEAIDVP